MRYRRRGMVQIHPRMNREELARYFLCLNVGIDDLHSDQTMRRHRDVQHGCRLMNPAEVIDLE